MLEYDDILFDSNDMIYPSLSILLCYENVYMVHIYSILFIKNNNNIVQSRYIFLIWPCWYTSIIYSVICTPYHFKSCKPL